MNRLRVAAAVLACSVLAACNPFSDDAPDVDREAVLTHYVEAWATGGATLARTVAGDDVDELVASLRFLRDGGVVRTRVDDAVLSDEAARATAILVFGDGGEFAVPIRARFRGDRVRAEPAAVSARLDGFDALRVEPAGGRPHRGDILSRDGSVLARGPAGKRVVVRPAIEPAVAAIDAALDKELGGRQGRRLVASASAIVLAEFPTIDGTDQRTSLDDEMQAAAEQALGRRAGAFVAVDPRTGGIRALVSNASARDPERSPATTGYSPGSAFKIVTAAAVLEADVLKTSGRVSCPAELFIDQRFITNFESISYGPITFEKAFAVSCNTAFAQIGARVGTAALMRMAERFGLRAVPKLDGAGTIAVPRNRAELAVWSFGAAGSLTTPVQMAGIGSVVARGGTRLEPGWTDRDDAGQRAIAPATAASLVDFMEAVVESGTGKNARVEDASIAGKTGTGEPDEGNDRSNAWFVGLAPSRDTKVVAVALIIGGGVGGEAAAPVVRTFLTTTRTNWDSPNT